MAARADERTSFAAGGDAGSTFVKNATKEVRMGFVRKVYGILSAQLLVTCAIATPICVAGPSWVQQNAWVLYLSMAALLATMCSMCCCAAALRTYPTNYIFLSVMTVVMSVLVGFSSAMYTWQSVVLAAGLTAGIFVGMTIYAWTTTTDFTGAGPYLMAALLCLIGFGFTLSIMRMFGVNIEWGLMLYDACGVLLFTFYIVFDTQLIMGELGGHKVSFTIDDYCFAALNLYLDIINLFLHILSLLGERR
eukprot:TRINITY_DN115395_c0_g1_i1.p1 TRINITY_DN115395_c0_g1~~TRINITY_DN115395_c0_g1_i1.p1  ORF type:complete len:249 (-),score=59.18 TRINITY_DN115395_c0_g1_i1:53-799(-)